MIGASATVRRVVQGDLCSGCGLCAGVSRGAISMDTSSGFSRPVQTAPIDQPTEALIASACPGAVIAPWGPAPNADPCWGPWRQIYTGHSTDAEIRFRGSSGGALTALALFALKSGQVDRVIHVAADPANPTGNIITCSTQADEIIEGAGSRYAASSPLDGVEAMLSDGGAAAFIGKPCDVGALRQLALSDPRVDRHMPLKLAFFCAGIPNQRGVDRILRTMGVAPEEVASFRYRGNGWPGAATAVTHDGRTFKMSYADSWGEHLSPEVQFRCKICPDAVGGAADLACADAWYEDENGYPSFDEGEGRSMIVTRTAVGERLLNDAVAKGAMQVDPLDVAEIEKMQGSQGARKRAVRARFAGLAVTLQPRPVATGAMIREASAEAPFLVQIRNFLGTVRRVAMGRK